MKIFFAFLLSIISTIGLAQHDHSGSVTNAKAVEIASHRIGRLVDTGKISESFIMDMNQLDVKSLPHHGAGEPAFQINLKLVPNTEGKYSELEMILDMKGKFLSHKIVSEVTDGGQVEWPDAPVSELVESALHYLTEQSPAGLDLKPFNKDMKSMTISQSSNSDGTVEAVLIFETSSGSNKLEMSLSERGDVLNLAVIQ